MRALHSTIVTASIFSCHLLAGTVTLDFTNLIDGESLEPAVSIDDGNQIVRTKLGSGASYVTHAATPDTPAAQHQEKATALSNWAYPEAKWVKQTQAIENEIYLEFTFLCAADVEAITGIQIDYVPQGKKAPKKATLYVSGGKAITGNIAPKTEESDKIKLLPGNEVQTSEAIQISPVKVGNDKHITIRLYFWDYPPKENNKSKLYIDKITLTTA